MEKSAKPASDTYWATDYIFLEELFALELLIKVKLCTN